MTRTGEILCIGICSVAIVHSVVAFVLWDSAWLVTMGRWSFFERGWLVLFSCLVFGVTTMVAAILFASSDYLENDNDGDNDNN